ncbi:MAG TPA: endonuclease/exonuclease/phosphatase family protein [Phycisphaerales bacterium]|nr:endonuclease/exonuclease/phosphatase family protein [Phycisphaerales bacterium]HMP35842.1 endonuclease/exonuclease/phosphatase family protein [Phycisphaerales bacterium]
MRNAPFATTLLALLLASLTGACAATDAGAAARKEAAASSQTAPEAAPPRLAQPLELRVLSWNIRHGRGLDDRVDLERIATVVAAANADVVLLQEVDRSTRRSGGVDQAAWLGERLGMHSKFGAFMPFDGGEYGLAILSRWPLTQVENLLLPPGRHEPRTSLAASIRAPIAGAPSIRFYNVHLDWLDEDSNRYAQARSLLDQISGDVARRDHGASAVLGGDFNDVAGSRTIDLVAGRYAQAGGAAEGSGARVSSGATFPSDAPSKEIDFVFVEPGGRLRAGPAEAIDARGASDHRPVLAIIIAE